MKKKVVVLGSQGMAGHIMAEHLSDTGLYEVIGVARQPGNFVAEVLDVTDFKLLETFLASVKPEIIVNCVGALVAHSANQIASAVLLNSYLPHLLSQLGDELGYKLIHISTDCVFSGKDGGYTETSFRDGDDNYARSKALGEVVNDKDLTVRTSIIGPELKDNGTGLLDWFLKQEGEIEGYTKAYWSGVTTLELARAVHEMIKQGITGLYQLCPEQKISKYHLMKLFNEVWSKNVLITAYDEYAVDKSLVCTRTDFKYPRPEYKTMLGEAKIWMDHHATIYGHYV